MMIESDLWRALLSGDIGRAETGFRALRAEGAPINADVGLFLAAVLRGDRSRATKILEARAATHGDLGLLLWRAAWIGAKNGLERLLDILTDYFDSIGAPSGWRAPIAYGRGHVALVRGDADAALNAFLAAADGFAAERALYIRTGDEALTSAAVQCLHLLPADTVDRLARIEEPVAPPPEWLGKPPDPVQGGLAVMVAADPNYLKAFGAAFTRSLAQAHPNARLHIHLMDGDRATLDSFLRDHGAIGLAQTDGSLSTSDPWPVQKTPIQKAPIYASARFFLAPYLLERLHHPILLLDIDQKLRGPIDSLFETAERSDFACWRRPDGGPGGYVAAGATAFSPTGGAALARLAGAYIDARLQQEADNLWFVDQAALFRAAHYHESRRSGFRWADFGAVAGSFDALFDHAPESETKRR